MLNLLTVGNPNSGKTTLFNALTGTKQRVGNWPGVTVDKKTGQFNLDNKIVNVTDLPGIYSLDYRDTLSIDEKIATQATLHMEYDMIINIVDVSQLERSLYLSLQLRELNKPMVVVLNKEDLLNKAGKKIDCQKLEAYLNCPIYLLSSTNQKQVDQFKSNLKSIYKDAKNRPEIKINYSAEINTIIDEAKQLFSEKEKTSPMAIFLKDPTLLKQLSDADQSNAKMLCQKIDDLSKDNQLISEKYTHIQAILSATLSSTKKTNKTLTEKIDSVVLNPYLGLFIFLFVMYLMFMFSINIGSAFIDFFDIAFGAIFVDAGHHLFGDVLPVWLSTILFDGIGGGIQTVATFIPVIAGLFLFLSILESSGYMTRAAFVLDKLMQKVGIPGKAFVPLVLGFGCNVPAIMATRTLDQERERKLSAAMAPFMSCGARLPVYVLFAAAFFPNAGQTVVFILYLMGIIFALLTGFLLKNTLYPAKSSAFIMDIPDYEIPTIRGVLLKTWFKLKRFVFGAGKTIVLVVAILSFFNSLGTDGSFGNEDTPNSVLAKASQVVTPVFEPMGVQEDNWPATVGIITGIFAKEAVVGTLNNLYSDEQDHEEGTFDIKASLSEAVSSITDNFKSLSYSDPLGINVGDLNNVDEVAEEQGVSSGIFANLQSHFSSSAAAFAYLTFVLLYIPCVAAMGAYAREFGNKYARFIALWTSFTAYTSAVFIYQSAIFKTQPVQSSTWLIGIVLAYIAVFYILKNAGKKQDNMEIQVVNV